ncbi:phosphoglycerate dehydrogenase [Propionicicella superfundia]|uniref:phosphoglycerate dehydrogenase n=1 Tax=Propionicicella superfundia TaxID=348582 RepID=UPI00041F0B2A|nr:phosphoglycerate dehydrogenase [Propionicicella superfundia]
MIHRIRTLNAISPSGLNRFPHDFEVGPDVADPEALLVRSANLHGLEIPGSVLAVARAGAGTNNIPIPAMSERGVPVFNTPGANANAVKELVIGGLLTAARSLVAGAAYSRSLAGSDAEIEAAVEKGKKQFVGFELPGRTMGVIGLGAIGVLVANAAVALGMRVIGYDPKVTVERAWQLSASVEHAASLDEVFKRADVVTTHVPLLDGTRGLVSYERLALRKRPRILLNFARGPIVDEAGVLRALDEGLLRAYVCDFPSAALNAHPKVLAFPHLGASTNEAEENCAVMAVESLSAFLLDGTIVNSVNFPAASLPRAEGTTRLAIANSNVPNMVGQMSTLLADRGHNIADLLNKSRGEIAYTLIDIEGEVSSDLLDHIRAIEGVLSARLINGHTAPTN